MLSNEKDQKKTLFTYSLDEVQVSNLYQVCRRKALEQHHVEYSSFAFKGKTFNLVMYQSGKLVIQGKGATEFVEFELEPKVLLQASMGYDEVTHPEWFEEHAGMDESGKGDLFGPLVTACVVAGGDVVRQWIKDGVRDSKSVSNDKAISELEKKILSSDCESSVMYVGMEKYNELYDKFGRNMNVLLSWMHSCSLKNALEKRYVPWGLLDQFSKQPTVEKFLKKDNFDLRMRTKAEDDPVVAAASILARAEYNRQMNLLSDRAGFKIQKGASKLTIEQANEVVDKFGYDSLKSFAKTHFATCPKIG